MRKMTLVMIVTWSLVALLIVAALIGGIAYRSGGIRLISSEPLTYTVFQTGGYEDRELLLDKTISAEGIEAVRIVLGSDDVNVLPSTDGKFHVLQYGLNLPADRIITVNQSGSSLTVKRQETGWGGFRIFGAINNHSWVEVYIPAAYNKYLDLGLSSGKMEIETDLSLERLTTHLSSGSVQFHGPVKAGTADLSVSSGNMEVQGLDCTDFVLRVSSGGMKLRQLTGSGSASVTSGSLKVENYTILDHLDAKVSSGSMKFSLAGDPSLQFAGWKNSGDLKTYFKTYRQSDRDRFLSATVGDGPYKTINASVSSGLLSFSAEDSSQKSSFDQHSAFDGDNISDRLDEYWEKWDERMERWEDHWD